MAQVSATFNIPEFELRNYSSPYLSPDQAADVVTVGTRVNEQLDFLAQMLGWNGPNYWGNLPDSPDQKRQILGGTFGVYNSYVIPKVYEIRNWDNKIVVDRLQFLEPGRQTQVARVVLGDDTYQIQSVEVEGDRYVISLGDLGDSFFSQISANVPLKVDVPTFRPAPFNRPEVGISGDSSFVCDVIDGNLVLYPSYDTRRLFPYRSNVLFSGSVYYFDQPVYFSTASNLSPAVSPTYDADLRLWFLQIPSFPNSSIGITGYLALANSNPDESKNASTEVLVSSWSDPSDWGSEKVLNNFRGVWGNKGGQLPFNFVFDALSIHGLNESASVSLPVVERSLSFNEIVNFVYYQKTVISPLSPGGASLGDIWWNDSTGALAVWLPDTTGCAAWVEIDYRNAPQQLPPTQVVYSDISKFRAAALNLPPGAIVRITNSIGLTTTDNVVGLQGTLKGSATVIMHKDSETSFWVLDELYYLNVTNFGYDAGLLPFNVPVIIRNANGLKPNNGAYQVLNLKITISGKYEVILKKQYYNNTWELYADSILKYIANTALFGGLLQGEMWWDYVNADPTVRAAAIFDTSFHPLVALSIEYAGSNLTDGVFTGVDLINLTGSGGRAKVDITVSGGVVTAVSVDPLARGDKYTEGDLLGADPKNHPGLVGAVFKVNATLGENWVSVNREPQSGPPSAPLNLGATKFYCDGNLLTPGTPYVTDGFTLTYVENAVSGAYEFSYAARTFKGSAQTPNITVSDAITSAYRADISGLVFSGLTYTLSPNVYNAETPLRLWKTEALQVSDTVAHLEEDNYVNPLLADLNNGPGLDNWEKYFVRLPLEYGRNSKVWQKISLVCQNFGYWGSSIDPEKMRCPPEDDTPAIYEELFLYEEPIPDYTYVYCEPYLYSNIAYFNSLELGPYQNAGIFPASDVQFDEFSEASLIEYDPLHERQADVTSPVSAGYGDWLGEYVNVNPCVPLTGFFVTDLLNRGVEPVAAPVWDASIYKFAPTCENNSASYSVDANHYKICYGYFAADASAAEDPFFDVSQEASWRYPISQPKTLYMTPR